MESAHLPSPAGLALGEDKLRHMPASVRLAYERFKERRDPADLDVVTVAILQDFRVKALPPASYARETLLIEGLGYDSLAIAEIVFYAEDLFRISITNDEIVQVRSVGDLCDFVRAKLGLKPLA
jgi:acyl carrier protein